jgi:diguanylate cyclase (GGDEF)-like protein
MSIGTEPTVAGQRHRAFVLVADDDEAVRKIIRSQLEWKGHQVIEACDGREAIDLARRHEIDLALIDVNMPGVDGYQVLKELKATFEDRYFPVVLVTARTAASDVATAMDLGAHDYLRKPVEPVELLARVQAAVEVKRLHDDLRRQNRELALANRTDPLTGIYNRRRMEEELMMLASAAHRHHTPLAALVVDIDQFKVVNDARGHVAGDAVLRRVAEGVRLSVRTEDVVGRWGGDEFLVLLPSTDSNAALMLAERIRNRLATEGGNGDDIPRVTVSIGCAAGCDSEGLDLVRAADMAMYRAKAEGRDRVSG